MSALRLAFMLCNCSNEVNWASYCVNWVLSIGERGFWCSNWATRSFIKVSFGFSFVVPWAAPADVGVTADGAVVDGDGLGNASPAMLLTLICSQAPYYGERIAMYSLKSRHRGDATSVPWAGVVFYAGHPHSAFLSCWRLAGPGQSLERLSAAAQTPQYQPPCAH